MKTTISTFKATASYPEQAIVMIFDLEGFSKFFSQPDVHNYVPKYLNIIMNAFELIINGGELYWNVDEKGIPEKAKGLPGPIHSKFLGDGALYIWKQSDFTHLQLISLINRLFNLRNFFELIVAKATEEVPVLDIPKNIRIGISAGSVYKLTYINSNREEYIGYSINLASRLQSYCREIGFIVSGRLNIKSSDLEKHLYQKLVAIKIKGFPQEIVIVDKTSYDDLDNQIKSELFQKI